MSTLWLLRALAAVFGAIWSLLQPAVRFLAWLSLLLAVIAFVADWTRWTVQGEETARSLAEHLASFAPGSLARVEAFTKNVLPAFVWDTLISSLLALSPWVSFTGLAIGLGWLGRRRESVRVFVN